MKLHLVYIKNMSKVKSETCCVLGGENVEEGGLDDGPEGDGPDSVGCEEDQDILDCSDQLIGDISLKDIVRIYLPEADPGLPGLGLNAIGLTMALPCNEIESIRIFIDNLSTYPVALHSKLLV